MPDDAKPITPPAAPEAPPPRIPPFFWYCCAMAILVGTLALCFSVINGSSVDAKFLGVQVQLGGAMAGEAEAVGKLKMALEYVDELKAENEQLRTDNSTLLAKLKSNAPTAASDPQVRSLEATRVSVKPPPSLPTLPKVEKWQMESNERLREQSTLLIEQLGPKPDRANGTR